MIESKKPKVITKNFTIDLSNRAFPREGEPLATPEIMSGEVMRQRGTIKYVGGAEDITVRYFIERLSRDTYMSPVFNPDTSAFEDWPFATFDLHTYKDDQWIKAAEAESLPVDENCPDFRLYWGQL